MPLNVNSIGLPAIMLSIGSGTIFLSKKKISITAIPIYTEHNTPNREENLKALIDLGMERGNSIKNEKVVPQKISLLSSLLYKKDGRL